MNSPNTQNFRQRRNNNFKKSGGGGRQDFRRGNSNYNASGNSNNSHARHPELDMVIDSRAAQRANTMRDKYQSMARDAQSSGDRVYAEFCLQHVEHYSRILNAYNESRPQQQPRIAETHENGDAAIETHAAEGQAAVVAMPPAPPAEEVVYPEAKAL
jgi:hypothetical protein